MRILFDQGTPVPLRRFLTDHDVATAYERGWSSVTNGDLIRLAELNGFELLITTDTNLRYQQNLQGRSLTILVLTTTSWRRLSGKKSARGAALSTSASLLRMEDHGLRDRMLIVIER